IGGARCDSNGNGECAGGWPGTTEFAGEGGEETTDGEAGARVSGADLLPGQRRRDAVAILYRGGGCWGGCAVYGTVGSEVKTAIRICAVFGGGVSSVDDI